MNQDVNYASLSAEELILALQQKDGIILEFKKKEEEFKLQLDTLNNRVAWFRDIIDLVPAALVIVDLDETIKHANKSGQKIMGADRSLRGVKLVDLVDEVSFAKIKEETSGRHQGMTSYDIKLKNGSLIHVSATPMFNDNNELTGSLGVLVNVTDFINQHFEAQNLETVGRLVGLLVHMLNNKLSPIVMALDMLALNNEDEYIRICQKSSLELMAVIESIRPLSGGGDPRKDFLDLNKVIEDAVGVFKSQVKIVFEKKEVTDCCIYADVNQISSTIYNIILNAVEALDGDSTKKREIVIETKKIELSCNNTYNLVKGRYICMTIKNFGPKIKEDDLKKIFQVCYSTKHNRSGLGLTLCYTNIEKWHQGHIEVYNNDDGVTFLILLPLSERRFDMLDNGMNITKPRILYLDDEDSLRDMVQSIGERLGYVIEVAAGGVEALEKFELALKNANPFTLLILDWRTPCGKGGGWLISQLRNKNYNFKAYVSSGDYNGDGYDLSDPIVLKELGFIGTLPKPFSLAELKKGLSVCLCELNV